MRSLVLLLVLASGCAARTTQAPTWQSPLHGEHPLVGKVWDVRAQQFVEMTTLEARAKQAHFVLLGETHDNPDHHRLQAELLRAVTSSGRRPAVAFEMLDVPQQKQLDAAHPARPDDLAQAVDWEHSGWPPFALYRPIFEVVLQEHLPIVAANLSRAQARQVVKEGVSALDPEVRERLTRNEPLPEDVASDWRQEMRDSHCGALPEPMVDPMVLAQRARDAQLESRMLGADQGDGVVLIAGAGHVRNDRGVPMLLKEDRPDASILSVGLLEVAPDQSEVGQLPFDFVVFTPAAAREDPCEALRSHSRG